MNNALKFIILGMLLFTIEIAGQTNYKFDKITIEDGLSNSSVTCIFQDQTGFMWFGTQDGLNRYDGYKIKIFKNKADDSTTISDNFIFSIIEDSSGVLYFETQSGKINRYDPLNEAFTVIPKEDVDFFNVKMNSVLAQFYDKDKTIWSGGLSKETGLKKENIGLGSTNVFRSSSDDPSSISDDKVYSILRDTKGNLWIGTANGLERFNEDLGNFVHFQHNESNSLSISDNWVWPIFEDSKGNLWIGTVKGGLNKYDYVTNTFQNFKNDPSDSKSINDNFIFSIYEDRSGLIWIGTNAGGLNYFNPSSNVFEHYFNNPDTKNTLSDNTILSIFVDSNGKYFIGTRNGGLNIFDYKNKKFSNFSNNPSGTPSLLSNSIMSIHEDKRGIYWIGTFSSGLNAFNPQNGKVESFVQSDTNPNAITDNRIYAIEEDKDGIIWLGTYAGGLNRLDPETGEIVSFTVNDSDSMSISSNSVWSLMEDKSGNLWIGTFGGGLNYFDKSNQKFIHFKNDPENINSIGDNNIIRIFRDTEDSLWIGTTKGLSRYLGNGKFINYSEKDGLPNNFIYGILEDDESMLWMSTNLGLSRFDPVSGIFTNFTSDDGLQNNEFNQNAFAKDPATGNLIFGGVNGFNVFNPKNIKGNSYIPPVVFTNYSRFNTDNAEGIPIIEKGISERDRISISHKDNIITLEFAALSYYNNSQNQYRYKLEGFNENWIQLQNENKITFTHLSPGKYNLMVHGSNNDGVWNNEGESLEIIVLPPWWRTDYAYAAYLIFILGSLYGVRRFEINRREQKTKVREAELKMKATDAENRALQIENDRKTKELEDARQMQLSMLPKELPDHPGLEIAVFMRTATEVGGDYYDFLEEKDGTLNIAFGDATGHGLQAGTMVTLMKGFFISEVENHNIQDFMMRCSSQIKKIKLGRILMSFSYLKVFDGKLNISSGGMPPIYFYNNQAEVLEEIVMKGMPLGAMAGFPYNNYEKELKSGDTLLLITDGLPEQMNDKEEMYDYPRVKDKFIQIVDQKPQQIIDSLVESCDNWMNGAIQEDDITLMVIKVK